MHWAQEAIYRINNECISHRYWNQALPEAFSLLNACNSGEIFCITGPSRSGKSRLIKELSKRIVGDPSHLPEGVMPLVSVLATNCSTNGFFSTKSFIQRCHEAIQHPIYGVNSPTDPWGVKRFRTLHQTPEATLNLAFISALKYRRSLYLVIDESQHIRYAPGGDKNAGAILDSWKCLAEEAKVVLVLVGAYPLLNVLKLCTHAIGRKRQIHLPRYHTTSEDIYGFLELLEAYTKFIRLPPDVSSLSNWAEILYEGSFGCIGLLEGWLRDALAIAQANEADCLSESHIFKTRKLKSELAQLAQEILEGEELIYSDVQIPTQNQFKTPGNIVPKSTKKKQAVRKPFKKKPKRYRVNGRS